MKTTNRAIVRGVGAGRFMRRGDVVRERLRFRIGSRCVWMLVLLGLAGAVAVAAPVPLKRAHAHNDYEHARPLLDALDHGFCSVEADIYLVEGRLLVAHDREKVRADRTLQSLYLDPLRERVKANNGRVYPGGPEFTLLVDLKSGAESTYAVLREVLAGYREMLTRFTDGETRTGAVTVILSGNRPRTTVAGESVRWVGIDGRLPDLEKASSRHLLPLISDNWRNHFSWRGEGMFPEVEREKLKRLVETAHARGQRIRFWATPDRLEMWMVLHEAGSDLLNTDDLNGLSEFLSRSRR